MTDRFVIDASIAVSAWLPDEDHYLLAGRLLDHATQGLVVLVAPDHLRLEAFSAITRASCRRRIPVADARRVITRIPEVPLAYHALDWPLILRAAEISLAISLGFYDCRFVALAEQLGLPLVTSNDRHAGSAGQFAPVLDLPTALDAVERDA